MESTSSSYQSAPGVVPLVGWVRNCHEYHNSNWPSLITTPTSITSAQPYLEHTSAFILKQNQSARLHKEATQSVQRSQTSDLQTVGRFPKDVHHCITHPHLPLPHPHPLWVDPSKMTSETRKRGKGDFLTDVPKFPMIV